MGILQKEVKVKKGIKFLFPEPADCVAVKQGTRPGRDKKKGKIKREEGK